VDTAEEFRFKILDNGNSLCAKDPVPFDAYKLFYTKVSIDD
jgi:serine/threonine protein kinase